MQRSPKILWIPLCIAFFACGEDTTGNPNQSSSNQNTSSVGTSSQVLSGSSSSMGPSSTGILSSSSLALSSSAQTLSSSNQGIVSGFVVDTRDGQTYKTTKIGTQVWMAENLNYAVPDKDGAYSSCYDNDPKNCEIYGRLYDWFTTLAGAKSSAAIPSGVQGICPSGWHLPSQLEWEILAEKIASEQQLTAKKASIISNGIEIAWN